MTISVAFRKNKKYTKRQKRNLKQEHHRVVSHRHIKFREGDLVKLTAQIPATEPMGPWAMIPSGTKVMIVSINFHSIEVLYNGKLFHMEPHRKSYFHLCPIGK